jgi:Arc/MetJ-type ribon-helix-helix transcriptional regulator
VPKAQVTLTDAESKSLRTLAERTGKSQDELLREAVRQLLAQSRQDDRLRLLQQARGIWKERDDLPELHELRGELERF